MNRIIASLIFIAVVSFVTLSAQPPIIPAQQELNRPFGDYDCEMFRSPSPVYHPETWFHFIGGNVARPGITADLEAIAGAGLSGIQLFHGQFGGKWPGVDTQITCLSETWDDLVQFTAEESRRLGLRFTMQNCPGWAMSGGPWIKPENAMRQLVMSRTDLLSDGKTQSEVGTKNTSIVLPFPQPSSEEWRNYQDITVLAFPTPLDDTDERLKPVSVHSDINFDWKEFISGETKTSIKLPPVAAGDKHTVEVIFDKPVTLRTVEFSSINGFIHAWCYEPGITVKVKAIKPNGNTIDIVNMQMPQASWQDDRPISLACDEEAGISKYLITIENRHEMSISSLRLLSAARKNNWESEAGWTLRSIVREGEHPRQSPKAFIALDKIIDISEFTDKDGRLHWKAPKGPWTILRIGHVNAGRKNAPAPPEGTGWECDKLSSAGPEAHFAGYIGRLADGVLNGGLLNGMLLDSWECSTQTWTDGMDKIFTEHNGYDLKRRLPAVFGYVVDNHEESTRFLLDWRRTIGDLFANKFYGGMAKLASENGLDIQYETAAGDIFPADIMEYYKHADVPMAEFWQPHSDNYVGSINFKPIKPTASASRIYGKPRVAAEAFTSFALTWDEHWSMLKEVANLNFAEGVTHLVFHTYTHNPRTDWLPPGTSFGSDIGTPFLRGQTWWRYMPEFTACLSRLNYLLERGKPVSDVLWYLGDEINHKPDQKIEIKGYKYDYCNSDVLLNRLSVRDGKIVTPEGLCYSVLWLPDNERMLPETLEKLVALVRDGAVIVGNAPTSIATLTGGDRAQQRFDKAVSELWGDKLSPSVRSVGKGQALSGFEIGDALNYLDIKADVTGGDALWLHRQTDNADWYFVSAPYGKGFNGMMTFNNTGFAEIWDPVSGEITKADVVYAKQGYSAIRFDLERAGSCFVVFRKEAHSTGVKNAAPKKSVSAQEIRSAWTLSFPDGWGVPEKLEVSALKAWKDLDLTPEGKAFSGTVTYTTTFDAGQLQSDATYMLDLGRVEMIASVTLNGRKLRTLWTPPYQLDVSEALRSGENRLQIEVTGTWFNRLVYDANQPENERKTWVISGPDKNKELRESGLLGPVVMQVRSRK
ncbi:MAG: hypothetical protein LBR48_02630 [Dysgonamonadaceae bacterium]|nr:hypothetical protein [Dysgonamonadaceae bacterium]